MYVGADNKKNAQANFFLSFHLSFFPSLHRGHAPLVFWGEVTGASLEALGAPTHDQRLGQRALEERSCGTDARGH